MTLSALGIFSAAGAGGVAGDYELIQTQILGSNQASITFSNLGNFSAVYKHLQIRVTARLTFSDIERTLNLRMNGDTGTNYSAHGLLGTGSSVISYGYANYGAIEISSFPAASATANAFGGAVVDILDAYSTTKNKTVRSLGGASTSPQIRLSSGVWRSTNALTSITLIDTTSNLVTGSRFSLYGIRG
jgi:hypothetical protein